MNYRALRWTGLGLIGVASVLVGLGAGMDDGAGVVEQIEQDAAEAKAVEFGVDGTHSSVVFRIEHSGVSRFYGRFSKVSGTFTIDPADGALSAVKIEIPAESIDTNAAGRDRHLKGTDFFDAKQYPTLSFVSTNIAHKDGDFWNVTGDYAMHGVTKPITVEIEVTGYKKGQQGYLGGIASEFVIQRSEFGMTHYVESGGLGDAVTIMVGLEGRGE